MHSILCHQNKTDWT